MDWSVQGGEGWSWMCAHVCVGGPVALYGAVRKVSLRSRSSGWGSKRQLMRRERDFRLKRLMSVGSASLMVQTVKNLPAMWETHVQSLGWEDTLEESLATHSSIFAWRIPWTEEPGKLQSMGWQKVGHDWASNIFTFSTQQRAGKHLCYYSHTQQGHTCVIISGLVLLWHLLEAKCLVFLLFP